MSASWSEVLPPAKCSSRAATEFAFRQSVREVRVAHRDTDAQGAIIDTAHRLNDFDEQGPWVQVDFDDGLTCWVPSEKVQVLK